MIFDVEHVLGKVTGDHPTAGGPDALLDIVVERRWLREGRTIEVDLPRHLVCAACLGAGCDVCGQSGAITVRGRSEPPEVVRVTLPHHDLESDAIPESSQRSILLRIQGRGGLPESGVWPAQRGRLLLRIRVGGTLSGCVREVPDDEVVSSSTVSRADYLESEPKPASSVAPVTSAAVPEPVVGHAVDGGVEGAVEPPATRRSVSPVRNPVLPLAEPAKKVAKAPPVVARSRGRLTWRDVVIGLFVLLIGAALAWFFV